MKKEDIIEENFKLRKKVDEKNDRLQEIGLEIKELRTNLSTIKDEEIEYLRALVSTKFTVKNKVKDKNGVYSETEDAPVRLQLSHAPNMMGRTQVGY